MANLKALKIRISSVKSTQKITKAMKMVAASKLRRAQERAEQGRPYSEKMAETLALLAAGIDPTNAPAMMVGRRDTEGKLIENTHLIVVATADRGLCGGFNSTIIRAVKQQIEEAKAQGKKVQLLTVGRKGHEVLKLNYSDLIIDYVNTTEKRTLDYITAEEISDKVAELFEDRKIDSCSIVFNKFVSALQQDVHFQPLIPLTLDNAESKEAETAKASYCYEPESDEILKDLLPRNVAVQIYHALLENSASEQGARMTAMDNATRNAGDMIQNLTLQYNRTRQAAITTELTEIISGAEAL